MKGLISSIGDRLQAIFPPNRVMLLLAGPITAGSLWLSAWLTAHVPGVTLPAGVIAGGMGVVGLIVVTLIYKWFDQWQKSEFDSADLEQALAEVDHAFLSAHGTVQGIGAALRDLHDRIANGSINEAGIVNGVSGLLSVIDRFVEDTSKGVEAEDLQRLAATPGTPPAPAAPAPAE